MGFDMTFKYVRFGGLCSHETSLEDGDASTIAPP